MTFLLYYWQGLFWINVLLCGIHAVNGSNMMFLAFGLALISRFIWKSIELSTEK